MRVVPVDVYSRVVGYYSSVNLMWNKGKRAEFEDRKECAVNSETFKEKILDKMVMV